MPRNVRTFARLRNAVILAAVTGALLGPMVGVALRGGPRLSMSANPAEVLTASMMEEHGCWTGEPPADMVGKIPGHVVVRRRGEAEPVFGGRRLTGLALEQVFNGKDAGLVVVAFCR